MTSMKTFRLVTAMVGVILGSMGLVRGGSIQGSVATVGGVEISEGELMAAVGGQSLQLRKQEYELKRKALDQMIEDRLLAMEAKRRGMSVAKLLEVEVDAKEKEPTEAELEAFFLGQTGPRPQGGELSPEARSSSRRTLLDFRRGQLRAGLIKDLMAKTEVRILLAPPKAVVGVDPNRLLGPPNAQITIVEFSDFQCPYCSTAQETLKALMTRYPGKVRVGFRDFPIAQIHPSAIAAAEASRCAADQGRFWEFHDLLFANQKELSAVRLKEYASSVRLDRQKFDACVAERKHQLAVQADFKEGQSLGLMGTPAFFVNGELLNGARDISEFERIINQELSKEPPTR
jgi:protein-disulfide isomerase